MRAGLAGIDAARREAHASAVLGFRREDGGFSGRRGGSDLYYTGFAVRALHALDRLDAEVAAAAAGFAAGAEPSGVVEVFSAAGALLLLDAPADADGLLARLEEFRAADGGYAKSAGRGAGDIYLTFLAALCRDLFGRPVPGAEKLGEFLAARAAPDGGFGRAGAAARSGTNPTAAGIVLLGLCGSDDAGRLESAARFLAGSVHESGGWAAGARAPGPDLLSTYTALTALGELGALDAAVRSRAAAFAASCERPGGGFSAGPWDPDADAEYTYYGLGVLALT
jgi:geranylgeranyl transferase type-2 subunit beta